MDRGIFIKRMETIFQPINDRSGRTFYTPSKYWGKPFKLLYIGYNPGGSPTQEPETITVHWQKKLDDPDLNNYSEQWPQYGPSEHPLQRVYFGLRDVMAFNEKDILGTNIFFAREMSSKKLTLDAKDIEVRDSFLSLLFNNFEFQKVIILGKPANTMLREFFGKKDSEKDQRKEIFLSPSGKWWYKIRIWDVRFEDKKIECVCIPHPGYYTDQNYGKYDSIEFFQNMKKIANCFS